MTTARVENIPHGLGAVGALLGVDLEAPPIRVQQDAVRRLESVGWPSVWTNEIVGGDALVRASLWLAASERIVVGTCVANMWARPPQTVHAAAVQLDQAYPDRFVLGLGVGRPEQAAAVGRDFGTPSTTARRYLEGTVGGGCLRLLAANGPRMLELAARNADGALPAGVSPAATAAARAVLGSHKLLVVYVPLTGSEPVAEVADRVREHRAAGADHVIVGQRYDTDFVEAVEYLADLAPGLEP